METPTIITLVGLAIIIVSLLLSLMSDMSMVTLGLLVGNAALVAGAYMGAQQQQASKRQQV